MKTKMKIAAMTFLLILGGTAITKAQYGRVAPANRPNAPLGYCMDIPDLTEEQTVKITALNDEHRAAMDQLRTEKYNAPDLYARNEADMKMLAEMNSHMLKMEALMTDTQKEYFRANYTNGRTGVRAYGDAGYRGRGAGMRAAGRGYGRGFNARPAGRGYGRGGYGPGYR
jgi:Spy/CpxP family protein refolding chaperone